VYPTDATEKIGQRVMVGDRVLVEEPDWADGRGAIAEVLPAKHN
jgi:ribosome biogenesis GTPase